MTRNKLLQATAIGLIAIVVLPALTAVAGAETAATPSAIPRDVQELAIQKYVSSVELKIGRVMMLVQTFNITLPDELQTKAERAQELITQAKQALEAGNYTEAARLASEAAANIAPVAAYVWANIPQEDKRELIARYEHMALKVRIEVAKKLAKMMRYMETNLSIELPPELKQKLQEAINWLMRANQSLAAGNLSEARVYMAKASIIFGLVTAGIHKYAHHYLDIVAAGAQAAKAVIGVSIRLEIAINRTVDLISAGNISEALHALNAVERVANATAYRVGRMADLLEERGVNATVVEAVRNLANALGNVSAKAAEAAQALSGEEPDTMAAIALLEEARDDLINALQAIQGLGLPSEVREIVHHAMEAAKLSDRAFEHMVAHGISQMSRKLDHMLGRLQAAYMAYMRGRMSEEQYLSILNHAKQVLETIRERLGDNAPEWLIQKIDYILNWIENHMPQ